MYMYIHIQVCARVYVNTTYVYIHVSIVYSLIYKFNSFEP